MKTLTPIAIIAICFGMYFLYIKPQTDQIKAISQKRDEYYLVLKKVQDISKKREELSVAYNSISQADIDRLNKMIPKTIDVVILANDLSTAAAQNRLVFRDYKADVGDSSQQVVFEGSVIPYKVSTISFKLDGSYNDFLTFLATIESNLRLLDVTGLTVEADPGQDKKETMHFSLQISTYSLN